ncbi:hypothetical protein C8J57DRAFT_1539818 [Mycena rebaudengoi]|nr:hypothetical protein C8J57DRAFT_1539818 [Mycena rebaudengoi]
MPPLICAVSFTAVCGLHLIQHYTLPDSTQSSASHLTPTVAFPAPSLTHSYLCFPALYRLSPLVHSLVAAAAAHRATHPVIASGIATIHY